MKLTWRLWALAIALGISVAAIINAPSVMRILLFILIMAAFAVVGYVKSKPGRYLLVIVIGVVTVYLALNSFDPGVIITSVGINSTAGAQGIQQDQIITAINGEEISSTEEYVAIMDSLFPSDDDVRVDIHIRDIAGPIILLVNKTPEISVADISRTNIQTGLDIRGGARALVEPERAITKEELNTLISITKERLNAFGIADVGVKGVTDLVGNRFMLVEIAGATTADLQELLSKQGKFEARIGNETVFVGGLNPETGKKDITSVARNDAARASVTECRNVGGYVCTYQFSITLSPEAAQRHADVTRDVPIDPASGGQYLTENLTLILDDVIVNELRINVGLQGLVTTDITISGSGIGATENEAFEDALDSMNQLQTILITGSLPFKVKVVKLDQISPLLGNQFVKLILGAGVISLLLVGILVFIRYKKVTMSMALLFTAFSELVILLGFAALIRWNLDLPSIAGILATIGTGVDQQIIILDEAQGKSHANIKLKMRRALFIVYAAYFTSIAALAPLFWAGAGLFKGFAITTIAGITAGVLITRPAFAYIVRKLIEK